MSRVEYAFLWRKKSQMLEIARGDFMKEKETVHTLVKPVTLCVNFIICNIISEQ